MEGFYYLDLGGGNLWYLLTVFVISLIAGIISIAKWFSLDFYKVNWLRWVEILPWPKFYYIVIVEAIAAMLVIPLLMKNIDLFTCGLIGMMGWVVALIIIFVIGFLLLTFLAWLEERARQKAVKATTP